MHRVKKGEDSLLAIIKKNCKHIKKIYTTWIMQTKLMQHFNSNTPSLAAAGVILKLDLTADPSKYTFCFLTIFYLFEAIIAILTQ